MNPRRLIWIILSIGLLGAGCPSGSAELRDGGRDEKGSDEDILGADADQEQQDDGGLATDECIEEAPSGPAGVVVEQGPVEGLVDGGVKHFLGIPFAKPPVGELRWREPQKPRCFSEVYQAQQWPPPCVQYNIQEGEQIGDEDCLYLNIWTPDSLTGEPEEELRPVLVFIHGGGNMFGSTSAGSGGTYIYEGSKLAERGDVVVVTVQYRLNIFGYAVDEALDEDQASGDSGNFGIRDQIAALEWVRRNIDQFGGDPDGVLLFGESGGAANVCALMTSPLSKGLFDAAIMQSGGCMGKDRQQMREWTDEVLTEAGCDATPERNECGRGLSSQALIDAVMTDFGPDQGVVTGGPSAGPTIGDEVVPNAPIRDLATANRHAVPFAIGSNADETATPLFGIPWMLTEAQYEARINAVFAGLSSQVLEKYPVSDFDSPRAALVAVTTDVQFTCLARQQARAAATQGQAPTYRYFYRHTMEGNQLTSALGAGHGIELFFQFQRLDALSNYSVTAADREMEEVMLHYWVGMAGGTTAVGDGLPEWPEYDGESDPYLNLEIPVSIEQGVRSDRCDFWEDLLDI